MTYFTKIPEYSTTISLQGDVWPFTSQGKHESWTKQARLDAKLAQSLLLVFVCTEVPATAARVGGLPLSLSKFTNHVSSVAQKISTEVVIGCLKCCSKSLDYVIYSFFFITWWRVPNQIGANTTCYPLLKLLVPWGHMRSYYLSTLFMKSIKLS